MGREVIPLQFLPQLQRSGVQFIRCQRAKLVFEGHHAGVLDMFNRFAVGVRPEHHFDGRVKSLQQTKPEKSA
jgi:hypothetical protein